MLGFSINVLTLLALILAIGIVVDDAIVVLENVQRRIELGESPLIAGVLGTRQVTFAVIATSLTLIAVFVPISFVEGQVGRLFTEFASCSAPRSRSRCWSRSPCVPRYAPSCSRTRGRSRVAPSGRAPPRGDPRLSAGCSSAAWTRRLSWYLLIALLVGSASLLLYRALPQELTPTEDRGVFFIPVTAPQGSTVGYTDAHVREVEAILQPIRDKGEAASVFAMAGRNGQAHQGFVVVRLVPWENGRAASRRSRARSFPSSALPGVRAFPTSPAGWPARQPHAAADRHRRSRLSEHQGAGAMRSCSGRKESRPAQHRNRLRAEPAAVRR